MYWLCISSGLMLSGPLFVNTVPFFWYGIRTSLVLCNDLFV
jgi:hypothetical protein